MLEQHHLIKSGLIFISGKRVSISVFFHNRRRLPAFLNDVYHLDLRMSRSYRITLPLLLLGPLLGGGPYERVAMLKLLL